MERARIRHTNYLKYLNSISMMIEGCHVAKRVGAHCRNQRCGHGPGEGPQTWPEGSLMGRAFQDSEDALFYPSLSKYVLTALLTHLCGLS